MSSVTHLPVVAGVEITTDEHGRFNLNALHRASGLGANKAPAQWLRTKQAQDLVDTLQSQTVQICIVSSGGRSGGTFAHEVLAVSYAGWISPAFQIRVNQVFIDYRTGKLKAPPAIPQSLPEALRLAAELAEEGERQQARIAELTPKAAALARIANTEDRLCMRDAAKVLGVQPMALIRYLNQAQWIYRRPGGGHWVAYQRCIQSGLLEHKYFSATRADGSEKHTEQVLVTAKGIAKLAEKLEQEPPPG